jgi:two-component system nitrogen regulation response regulator GlnG
VMTPSQTVEIADLPAEWRGGSAASETSGGDWSGILAQQAALALQRGEERIMDSLAAQFERAVILQALRHTNGRRIEAATLLGIGRNTLTRKINELGLDNQDE